MSKKVFISYRRNGGSELASEIQTVLNGLKFDCFLDKKSISPGKDYAKEIVDEVRKSQYFIMVLSPGSIQRCVKAAQNDSKEEDYVLMELREALGWRRRLRFALQFKRPEVVPIYSGGDDDLIKSEIELLKGNDISDVALRKLAKRQLGKIDDGDKFRSYAELVFKSLGGIPGYWLGHLLLLRWKFCALIITVLIGVSFVAGCLICKSFLAAGQTGCSGSFRLSSSACITDSTPMSQSAVIKTIESAANKEDPAKVSVGTIPCKNPVEDVHRSSVGINGLPSVLHALKWSMVSGEGVPVKSGDRAKVCAVDFLFKIEIDKAVYDAKIMPVLENYFLSKAIGKQQTIRFRNEPQRGSSRSAGGVDIEEYKSTSNSRYKYTKSDGHGDKGAQISSTALGDYRGSAYLPRYGSKKDHNMKAVVIKEMSSTMAKGNIFELPPEALDAVDDWMKNCGSPWNVDVILLGENGKELAVSPAELRYDGVGYMKYMSYSGGNVVLLAGPLVGGDSKAFYKWIRFNMSDSDAKKLKSFKVE